MLIKIRTSKKISLSFVVGICLLIWVGHNPASGYIKQNIETVTITKKLQECSEGEKEAYKRTLTGIYESEVGKDMKIYADAHLGGYKLAIENKLKDCHVGDSGMLTDESIEKIKQSKTLDLGFRDWDSRAPRIKWLGNTMHAIYASLGFITIGLIFVILI
jgi:hypothetical protein